MRINKGIPPVVWDKPLPPAPETMPEDSAGTGARSGLVILAVLMALMLQGCAHVKSFLKTEGASKGVVASYYMYESVYGAVQSRIAYLMTQDNTPENIAKMGQVEKMIPVLDQYAEFHNIYVRLVQEGGSPDMGMLINDMYSQAINLVKMAKALGLKLPTNISEALDV